jgi:hypothetical protein
MQKKRCCLGSSPGQHTILLAGNLPLHCSHFRGCCFFGFRACFLAAGFLAAGFLAAGSLAAGFLAAGFFAGFLAAGFLAAGFLATGFLAAGLLAAGLLITWTLHGLTAVLLEAAALLEAAVLFEAVVLFEAAALFEAALLPSALPQLRHSFHSASVHLFEDVDLHHACHSASDHLFEDDLHHACHSSSDHRYVIRKRFMCLLRKKKTVCCAPSDPIGPPGILRHDDPRHGPVSAATCFAT